MDIGLEFLAQLGLVCLLFRVGLDSDITGLIDQLSRADTFSVNHIPEPRSEWWENISADVIDEPHRRKIIQRLREEKKGYVNKVTQADTLGELGMVRRSDTHSVSIEIDRFYDHLFEDTFTNIDHYDIRRVALADFDGDDVSELLVSVSRVPDAKPLNHGYFGTIHGIGSGRILILNRDSPTAPLTYSHITEQSLGTEDG